MPPLAAPNLPSAAETAPVNAPFSWPNSSDSIRSFGNRAGVHRDERPRLARRALVHGARDQLLAGAGLADDEHGGVGLRDRR